MKCAAGVTCSQDVFGFSLFLAIVLHCKYTYIVCTCMSPGAEWQQRWFQQIIVAPLGHQGRWLRERRSGPLAKPQSGSALSPVRECVGARRSLRRALARRVQMADGYVNNGEVEGAAEGAEAAVAEQLEQLSESCMESLAWPKSW